MMELFIDQQMEVRMHFYRRQKQANHAASIEQMVPSGTLAVAWFTGGEGKPNSSIAVSFLEVGSQQFTPGVIVSQRIGYWDVNPVLFWDNDTQILHLYHVSKLAASHDDYPVLWHVETKDRGNNILQSYLFETKCFAFLGSTWSSPEPYYTIPGAFDRNRIIPTFDKRGLIYPCYNSSPLVDMVFILRSSSPTAGWTRIDINNTNFLIQPTIIRLNNSPQLRAFFS